MSWSAKQYVAFEDERTRPSRDLLAAIPAVDARSVIDVGCGPGNSTQLLVERFPDAVVRGLDSSGDMIEAARKRLPQVRFDQADIASWNEEGPFDVIFANAVFQWLPDHATLLPALVGKLAPGGSLAIQMPDNLEQPPHRIMREVAAQGPWADKLAHIAGQRTPLDDATSYYRMLSRMLFEAAEPHKRVVVFEHFYALRGALVERFYAGRSTWPDRLRILTGKPPVAIPRAIRALFSSGKPLNMETPA